MSTTKQSYIYKISDKISCGGFAVSGGGVYNGTLIIPPSSFNALRCYVTYDDNNNLGTEEEPIYVVDRFLIINTGFASDKIFLQAVMESENGEENESLYNYIRNHGVPFTVQNFLDQVSMFAGIRCVGISALYDPETLSNKEAGVIRAFDGITQNNMSINIRAIALNNKEGTINPSIYDSRIMSKLPTSEWIIDGSTDKTLLKITPLS